MKKPLLIFLLILVLTDAQAQHGGWTKPKGEGYYKLSQWWLVADEHFVRDKLTDPNATRGTFNTSLYLEHGLSERLTGIIYFPFFSRTYQNSQINILNQPIPGQESDFNNGIGDIDISLKWGLSKDQKKYVTALVLTLGLPTGEKFGGRDGSFQTGDGEFNQLVEFNISRSFKIGNVNSFGTLYAGFNNRTRGFSDETRIGAELGALLLKDKVWAIAKFNKLESLKNGTETAFAGGSLFSNNSEYFNYTLELAYSIKKNWGISASYSNAFSGEVIFADPAYSIGIYLDFK